MNEDDVINEFLRLLAEDRQAGHDRGLAAYQLLFPGHEQQVEAEYLGQCTSDGDPSKFSKGPACLEPFATTEVLTGLLLGGYRLVRFLGHGGMGQVWEAHCVNGGPAVALKLILPGRLDSRTLPMFEREARAGARLSHPGIVATLGFGETDGTHWIAQELVPGGRTLRHALDEARALDELPPGYDANVAGLAAELAEALAEAHSCGVIHRDLKPQNVLVTEDERVKVTDFGLARITDEAALSMTGDVAGTWFYMSPEQVSGRRMGIDHRTDVFSLGVVLYEMLTLSRPFQGDTTHQIVEKILTWDPPDPRRLRSHISAELAVICMKALEKRRDDRYQTMADLARDLRAFRSERPILARDTGELGRLWKRSLRAAARHRVWVAIVTVALVGAATGIVAYVMESQKANAAIASLDGAKRVVALRQLHEEAIELASSWPVPDAELADWLNRAQGLHADLPAFRVQLENLRTRSEGDQLTQFTVDALSELVTGTEELARGVDDPAVVPFGDLMLLRGVGDWSRVVRKLTVEGPAERWQLAARSIAAADGVSASELYALETLALKPQTGLIPIGMNPATKLWEFYHPRSAWSPRAGTPPATIEVPEHAPDGSLRMGKDTGLVFVLLPGGPGAKRPASFLSRYEMTQAQWSRLSRGENPSRFQPGDLLPGMRQPVTLTHPVEQVSPAMATEVLERHGLRLPSVETWVFACRAGTTSAWFTGDTAASLEGYANVRDLTAKDVGWGPPESFDDGFPATSPVGSFLPNPFGFHDMHGNVSEWTRDRYPQPDGENYRHLDGNFGQDSARARADDPGGNQPAHFLESGLGLRPARDLID